MGISSCLIASLFQPRPSCPTPHKLHQFHHISIINLNILHFFQCLLFAVAGLHHHILSIFLINLSSPWHLPTPPYLLMSHALSLAKMAALSAPWVLASKSASNVSFATRNMAQKLRSHATSNHTPLGPKCFRPSVIPVAGTKTAPITHQANEVSTI